MEYQARLAPVADLLRSATSDKQLKPIIKGLRSPCACGSGRTYGSCCLRLECIYFLIAAVAGTVLLVFSHQLRLLVIPVLLTSGLVGWLARRHYRKTGGDQ
jgi:hypothetical protein